MPIAITACVVAAYLIHIFLFIRYQSRGAANSIGFRVLWIIASIVLGPLVWPVWWLVHRSAKTPTSVYPQQSLSLSDPLLSKPSAPVIDDDDDLLYAHADARSGGAAARPSAAAASPVSKPPAPPPRRFDAAAGGASSFFQPIAQPAISAPAMDRVPDDMTDQ